MQRAFTENPFTPSFGEVPLHLAGRRQLIASFERALSSDRRRPELTMLLSGARGAGKTTLLSLLASQAERLGWVTASTTARPGMLEDIELDVRRQAAHLINPSPQHALSGIEVAHIGALSFDNRAAQPSNWRSRMNDVLDQLEEQGIGLLITVDEINPLLDEMIELAAVYQHFVRESRKVALLMAGLPHKVTSLLHDETVSFLRRAQLERLERVPDYEVEAVLLKTIRENGREADPAGVSQAVSAIGGFPFLLQLVGYRSWDMHPNSKLISATDFAEGIRLARHEMDDRILEATYQDLSPTDKRFLVAMLVDTGDTRTADLAKRLGQSTSQVAQYRRRLIEAGVIGSRGRGMVGFDMPYFREFLLEKEGLV